MQLGDDALDIGFQLRIIFVEVLDGHCLNAVALADGVNIRLNAAREQAAVILPCLHHHRKIGKLHRTVINIETEEVILENALCRLALIPTGGGINLHQHIESIDKDMTAAHAGVDDLDLFRLDGLVFLAEFGKLGFYLRLLLGFIQIVFPAVAQLGIGVSFQPKSAERVFHHIADDPVRREKLRRSRNAFLRDLDILLELGKGIIFQLGVVILVQPADDLHLIGPVLLINICNQPGKHTVRSQDIIGQQHFGIATHPLKHHRQRLIQGIALRQQQVAVQGFGLVVFYVFCHLGVVQPGQLQMQRIPKDLRLKRTGGIGEHTDVGGQVVIDLHKAQGDKAVEPSVGNLLHDLIIPLFLHQPDQLLPLGSFLCGKQPSANGFRR